MVLNLVLWVGGIAAPQALTAGPPDFSVENHSATDGAGAAFNGAALPLTVSGSNTLLIVAWHSEYDGGLPDDWTVKCSGVPGTLITDTNGYKGPRRFRTYYWVNPIPGPNTIVVTNDYNGANELAVSVILLTNVAQANPLGTTVLDVSTDNRTGESEVATTDTNDLVVHVIADALYTRGTLGPGEISRSIANDGGHITTGDASLWISTKVGEPSSTSVSSSGWASLVISGVAIVVHGVPGNSQSRPQIVSITFNSQGVASVVVNGAVGAVYSLEGSSNPLNWGQVSVQTNTTGSMTFTNQPANSIQFYRAKLLP